MKLWNLNTGEESVYSVEELEDWILRNNPECLARHGDGTWKERITYWRTWITPYSSEVWRTEPSK